MKSKKWDIKYTAYFQTVKSHGFIFKSYKRVNHCEPYSFLYETNPPIELLKDSQFTLELCMDHFGKNCIIFSKIAAGTARLIVERCTPVGQPIIGDLAGQGIEELRIDEFKRCYKEGVSIFLKDNPNYPVDKHSVITLEDVINYRYIVRSYSGPITQLIYDENECDGIIAEYHSMEEMVHDGWVAD